MQHVIATAGHVDHGKSTLIRALTGMEPDRWAEERRRGMTIDLGYAWTTLPTGEVIAFVDVPGHQRFVPNMLAGIGPVPAVLFVVAADEGWSAQSTEHLDALVALDVRHGVLALARADLGDARMAEAEARGYLAGTPLEGMPAVAVSAVTGIGLDSLRAALAGMVRALPGTVGGRTRLWVDRVFSVRGAGTVVTGTLSSGSVRVGGQLELHPSGAQLTVRGIQTLKQQVGEVHGVARVALNLRGVKAGQLRRGDALGGPGEWADAEQIDVRLTPANQLPAELMLHVGSAAVPVRVRPFGADFARLTLRRPLPVAIGDRGVLRDPGAGRVAAGALVLDPMPPALRRRGAAWSRAAQLATLTGIPDPVDEVARRGVVRRQDLQRIGALAMTDPPPDGAVIVGAWLVHRQLWQDWSEQLAAALDRWADAHQLQPGMPRRAVMHELDIPDGELVDALVRDTDGVVQDADGIHRVGRAASLPAELEHEVDRVLDRLATQPFAAPEAPELAAAGLTEKVLAVVVRNGRLVRLAPGIYLEPSALDEAMRLLSGLPQPFTAAQAREALRTTRRVALPLLEHLDQRGHTRRVDTQRRETTGR